MDAGDFKRMMVTAKSNRDLSHVDDSILHGCALPEFEPVVATIDQVARFVRWHALMLNGDWDSEQLTTLQTLFRRKVTMV